MRLRQRMQHRIKQMMVNNKYVEVDSKFLVIIFLVCLFAICISSFYNPLSEQGNMVTIRTLFSSLLGFLIENVSSEANKKVSKESPPPPTIGFQSQPSGKVEKGTPQMKKQSEQEKREKLHKEEVERVELLGAIDQGPRAKQELRVLLMGHVVLFIVIALVLGALFGVDEANKSLTVLRNTAFACVGFLISATKSIKK